MTTTEASPSVTREPSRRSAGSLLASTEIDTRLFGMVAALAIIWVFFNLVSGGTFLTARNLWNLSVQSASTAVMATGMVLIIVSRNIDLSIGAVLGFVGYTMAMAQSDWFPNMLGIPIESPVIIVLALVLGLVVGAAIGTLQGFIVSYGRVPAFIVTLGGFLVWRGLIFQYAKGQTISPLDTTFQMLGGGIVGTRVGALGEILSWILGIAGCAAIIYTLFMGRRKRRRYGFPLRPMWAEVLLGALGCFAALAAVWVANAYPLPDNVADLYATERGIPIPSGGHLVIPTGVANPVLILIGVALLMTLLANRRKFGRYVYAIGGNPEAAELGGVNVRRTIMLTFTLMGVLTAVSAAIQTARLNGATTNLGIQAELDVIAAAVIGGTSFAGGIGTITGAILGAVVMQSLRSGMLLLNVDSPTQDVVVGVVLVGAVGFDSWIRRRSAR